MRTKLIEEIKGLGKVYLAIAQFDEQIKDFNSVGIKYPVSVNQSAYMRLSGKDNVLREGTRTCQAPICFKDSPTIVARISPLVTDLNMCKQAIDFHRNSQYPQFEESIYAQYEKIANADKNKKPEKMKAIILPKREDYRIDSESKEARFFLENQETRKEYFKKFISEGLNGTIPILQIPVKTIDSQNKSIVNYLWFVRSEIESYLVFRYKYLYSDIRAFGVCEGTEGAELKKFSERKLSYNLKEIDKLYKLTNEVKMGNKLPKTLEKVLTFLGKLKG